MKFILFVLLSAAFRKGQCDDKDLFSSIHDLKRLYQTELEFSQLLFHFLSETKTSTEDENVRGQISSFTTAAYPDGQHSEPANIEDYISNPLNALGILHRLTINLLESKLVTFIAGTDGQYTPRADRLRAAILTMVGMFPTVGNFHDAEASVSLLQEAYQLNITAITEGFIQVEGSEQRHKSDFIPTWTVLSNLATAASNKGWWDTGMDWFMAADTKGKREGLDVAKHPDWKNFQSTFTHGKAIHDRLLDTRGSFSQTHRTLLLPFDKKLRKKKKYRKAKQGLTEKREKEFWPLLEPPDVHNLQRTIQENYLELCRSGSNSQELVRPVEQDIGLACRYHHLQDPFLRLAPLKLEEKNKEPFIVQIHEFLHESELEYYKDFAGSNLERSETTGLDTEKLTVTSTRTSKQAWLPEKHFSFEISKEEEEAERVKVESLGMDKESMIPQIPADPMKYVKVLDPVAFKISKRIEHATELSLNMPLASEQYQIANYGMGGQYETHLDAQGFHDPQKGVIKMSFKKHGYYSAYGDRIATFMVYLSDVSYGGRTVFPALGLSSEPKKGTAIFWLNMNAAGVRERLTYHGGCPVLIGSKWITNKWVGYYDQMLDSYKCGLDSKLSFKHYKTWRELQKV